MKLSKKKIKKLKKIINKKVLVFFLKIHNSFLLLSILLLIFGTIICNSYQAYYNNMLQKLEVEKQILQNEINSLQTEKQELILFDRIEKIAKEKGYKYFSSDLAASYKEERIE